MDAPTSSLHPDDPLRWQKRAGASLRRTGIEVVYNSDGSCRLNGRRMSCWQLFRAAGFKDRDDLFGPPVPGTAIIGDRRTPEERAIAILQGRGLEVFRWSFSAFNVEGKTVSPWELYEQAGFTSPTDLVVEHPVFRRIDPVLAASYLWNYFGIPSKRQVNGYHMAGKAVYPCTLELEALKRWSEATGHPVPNFKATVSGDRVRADLIKNRSLATFREGIHSPLAHRPLSNASQGGY